MSAYRCYFLDADDHIIMRPPPEEISAEDDTVAIQRALKLCEAVPETCHGIELWCSDRFVINRRIPARPAS